MVPLVIAAGIALLVALFFAFRGGSETKTTGDHTLAVTVRDAKPVGGVQHLTVDKGDAVTIRVTSDVADEVHVHGYDLMQDVAPGAPVQVHFTATIAGRFEIELESRSTPIAELEVR
jgi:heme/copper-type cytochrome/quinol oxidase subunit 2